MKQDTQAQVDALNQRGGRTLSAVDLVRAGTISAEAAAYVGGAIARGASVLTAANPGGAGKTAVLAALLGFLPERRPLVTLDRDNLLLQAKAEPQPHCYLVHEIGDGHWYGYLWGPAVASYLDLARGPHSVASCLHADTYEELRERLTSPPLCVPAETLAAVDFLLFLSVDRHRGEYRRRVAAGYEQDGEGGHRCFLAWDPEEDCHELRVTRPAEVEAQAQLLRELAEHGPSEWGEVRRRLLWQSGR